MVVLRRDRAYSTSNTLGKLFVISGSIPTEVTSVSAAQQAAQVENEIDITGALSSSMIFNIIPEEWVHDAAQRHVERMKSRQSEKIEYIDIDLPLNIDGADW